MSNYTLSLSPSTNPFPFSALVIASYVAATITFDLEVPQPTLKVEGKDMTDAGEIITALGLNISGPGDSTKVMKFVFYHSHC